MHNVLVAASALLLAHCGVFGARETTASPGYGTASVVVDLVLGAYSGATSEAIDYPAWYVMESQFVLQQQLTIS
jgi:hypothetical protein